VGVVVVVLVAVLLLLSVLWTISPEYRACLAAEQEAAAFREEVREIVGFAASAALSQERAARSYVEERRADMRRAVPIEKLKSYGVKNVRWSSLSASGIRTLSALHGRSVASLTSLPGVGEASAERVLGGAKAAAHDLERSPVPMPGTFLSTDGAVALVACVARAREAAQLPAAAQEALSGLVREVGRHQAQLKTQATMWRWAFAGQRRGQAGSVLHAAELVQEAVRSSRLSPEFADLRQSIDRINQDWPLDDARCLGAAVSTSYAALQDPITAVLRSVARSVIDWRTDLSFAPPRGPDGASRAQGPN